MVLIMEIKSYNSNKVIKLQFEDTYIRLSSENLVLIIESEDLKKLILKINKLLKYDLKINIFHKEQFFFESEKKYLKIYYPSYSGHNLNYFIMFVLDEKILNFIVNRYQTNFNDIYLI